MAGINILMWVVIGLTSLVFLFVCCILGLVIWDAKKPKSDTSDTESYYDPLDRDFSDNEDDIVDNHNISLRYFGRGRSSLTELYLKGLSVSNGGGIDSSPATSPVGHKWDSVFMTGAPSDPYNSANHSHFNGQFVPTAYNDVKQI